MSFAITGAIVGTAVSLGGAAIGLGGAALSGAGALGVGAVSTIATVGTSLAGTAIGAGGAVLGGIGSLGTSIYQTGAGMVSGAGTALFGGQASVPVLTGGEMGSLSQAQAAGGLFSNLSWDTIGNVAQLGYGLFTSAEDRKLAEKMIEAQRGAGYVVSAPGAPSTAFAPSIMIPAAAQIASKELDKKIMIKYAIYALIAYLLLKGFM